MIHLTRRMATKLVKDNINVTAIAPGAFKSDMNRAARDHADEVAKRIPARRIGTDEDMAGIAIYLASRAGDYGTAVRRCRPSHDSNPCHKSRRSLSLLRLDACPAWRGQDRVSRIGLSRSSRRHRGNGISGCRDRQPKTVMKTAEHLQRQKSGN